MSQHGFAYCTVYMKPDIWDHEHSCHHDLCKFIARMTDTRKGCKPIWWARLREQYDLQHLRGVEGADVLGGLNGEGLNASSPSL